MADTGYDADAPGATGTRPGPTLYALLGALAGIVVGFLLAWAVGGNPLSSTNEVEYLEVTVSSVSEEGDRLCWAEDPERRDSPQQCAVLALDPAVEVPSEGQRVTAGLVELSTPDGTEVRQVVHLASASGADAPAEDPEDEDPEDEDPDDDPDGGT